MTLFKDTLRWSLPLFWSGIAFAAFFTTHVMGPDAADTITLLPLGWAAAALSGTTACLNLLWGK
ncbi:MAG: hypothetical protein JNM45_01880 [Rhizobiales bacterium]|nr:hypothetical protein [Hyphomicrobiales bacterium]